MSRIFLSHSSADNDSAIALRNWLVDEGWDDLFLDLDPERGIGAGERWERALNEAAHRCEAVLFIVSRGWLGSGWCLKEFHLAAKLNKRMFGLLIEDIPIRDLPAELTSTWQMVNLARGSDHVMFRALMPDGREQHVTFSKAELARLKTGLTRAGLDPRFFAWPPSNDPDRPPYRGLRPMEAEDAGIFFGREAPIIEALDRLRGLREAAPPRFVAILGASGAGKSSFLRAGLMPRLVRDDRNFLVLPVLRPERAILSGETGLLRSLEQALKVQDIKQTRAELKRIIATGGEAIRSLLSTLAAKATPPLLQEASAHKPPTLIMAVDQAEELFQGEGAEEAETFLLLVKDLLLSAEPNLIILATIRSDSYERLQTAHALDGIGQQTLSLPPLPRGAYQTVIEGPALRIKNTKRALKIDPRLTEALLADIETGGAKDALPLLAFTLERLYLEHGGDGDLRLGEYRDLGGIAGSIEAAVDRALESADTDPAVPKDPTARLALMRRAFIPWLAGIDPESGSPRRSIARLSEIPQEARPIVQHLIDQRLLATDVSQTGEQTIEPAHEALLRQWSMLQGWLQEDLAQLSVLEGIKRASRDWLANAQSPAWLAHSAGRLEDAEALTRRSDLVSKLDASDRNYLAACRAVEAQRKDHELREAKKLTETQKQVVRRTRVGFLVACLLSTIALALAYYGFKKADDANTQAKAALEQREIALTNETLGLANLSQLATAQNLPLEGIQLSLLAWPRRGDEQRPALRRTLRAMGYGLSENRERFRFNSGDGAINTIALSSDESIVAVGSKYQTTLLDSKTGKVLERVDRGLPNISSVELSPDSHTLVVTSRDGSAILWDRRRRQLIAHLAGHEGEIFTAGFSRDGMRVVTGSWDDTAKVWSATTGALLQTLTGHQDGVVYAAFTDDGRSIVTASWDNTARLWNAATGELIYSFAGHSDAITSASVSPDGRFLATASKDRSVRVWDLQSGASRALLNSYGGEVNFVRFSPDSRLLVSASDDGTARIWSTELNKELFALSGHSKRVTSACFSATGEYLATASDDGTARIWNTATGSEVAVLKGHTGPLTQVRCFADGIHFVTSSLDGTVRFWTSSDGTPVSSFLGDNPRTVALSPDGKMLSTVSAENAVDLWDVENGTRIRELRGHEARVNLVLISPDGSRILTASEDHTARVWDARTGIELLALRHAAGVTDAAFSSDGKLIVTGSSDTTAVIWRTEDGKQIARLQEALLSGVYSVFFSHDDSRILLTSGEGGAELWTIANGSKVELAMNTNDMRRLRLAAFSPDDQVILTVPNSGPPQLWDGQTGEAKGDLVGHTDHVNYALFSPDGSQIVTASADDSLRIWDTASRASVAELRGHVGPVTFASFASGSNQLLSASEDATARIWDPSSGAQIAVFRGHAGRLTSVRSMPSGPYIVTTGTEGLARVWRPDAVMLGDVPSVACARLGEQTGLSEIVNRYGITPGAEICGENTPMPVDASALK